jgi:hypothetical protein
VLAETFIREFSDERAPHGRRSLAQLGQGHKLESVSQLLQFAPAGAGAVRGLIADMTRSRQELLAENAFLRQQLVVAARRVKRAHFRASDRALLVALAATFAQWREALVLVKPETLLRWHRQGFKLLWTWRSKKQSKPGPRLSRDVVELIRRMATANRLWSAERIRGELLKLGDSDADGAERLSLARSEAEIER